MSAVRLAEPELWTSTQAMRQAFAALRRDEPVSWQAERSMPGFAPGPGYWAVVRHADVVAVSTDPERFSSAPTTTIRDMPAELGEFLGSMVNVDDPHHADLRRIVSHAFTKRRIGHLMERINAIAGELVGAATAEGGGDLVALVAAPLPLQVICEMVGVPPGDRAEVGVHAARLGATGSARDMIAATNALHDYAVLLAERRRAEPTDDLVSALVQADVDGRSLDAHELASFFTLLIVAGAITTRHAISHGIVALHDHPDQRAAWRADPEGMTATAVDEIIRWSTPTRHFRRTATCDTTLGDVAIRRGDKVVVWYTSANQDDTVFTDPERFDLRRSPNPHVSFGAGPHFCLASSLARQELAAVFTALLARSPQFEVERATPIGSPSVDGYAEVLSRLPPAGA